MARTKSKIVKFRIDKYDFKCLNESASKEELTISEYIRRLIIKDCK